MSADGKPLPLPVLDPNVALVDDPDGWGRVVICPFCHHENAHTGNPYIERWQGRQDAVAVPIEGECGHRWTIAFGEHKGNVYMYTSCDPRGRS